VIRGRAPWLALLAFAILVGSLPTGLYDPFTNGDDDGWLLAVVLTGAHLGAALVLHRWWVLLLPLVSLVLAAAIGDELALWLFVFVAVPGLLVVVALGWGAGRLLGDRATIAGALVLAVAAVPMVWAAVEQIDRADAEKLSAAEQRRLPIEESLNNLCPHASTPPALERRLRREVGNLVAELERRPDALVDYSWQDSHTGEKHSEELTVEELAEQHLDELNSAGTSCAHDVQERLRAAMD
jgi:hypothetical protein